MNQPTDRVNCPACGSNRTLESIQEEIDALAARAAARIIRANKIESPPNLKLILTTSCPHQPACITAECVTSDKTEVCASCGNVYVPGIKALRLDLEAELEGLRAAYPLDALAEEAD